MANVETMLKNVKAMCMPITNIDNFIRRSLNEGQHKISSLAPKGGWFFLRRYRWPLSVTSGTSQYALSCLVDTSKIINFWDETDDVYIRPTTEMGFRMAIPDPTSDSGTSYIYRLKGYSPVQNNPSSASVLSFVSNSVADTGEIMLQGTNSSGVFFKETITLNGTTPVASTNSYLVIFGLSKAATSTGTITVTSNSGAVTNVVIAPSEKYLSHPVVDFYNVPNASKTLYYDFTLKLQDIYNDDDISLIDAKYHDVIEKYAMHKVFGTLREETMKVQLYQEFLSDIEMMKNENYQPQGITTFEDFSFSKGFVEPRLQGRFPRD